MENDYPLPIEYTERHEIQKIKSAFSVISCASWGNY